MTYLFTNLTACLLLVVAAQGADLQLSRTGKTQCVIVIPQDGLSWEGDDRVIDRWGRMAGATAQEVVEEEQRRLQRDATRDLALYLGRMIGSEVEITSTVPEGDTRIPLYIGSRARQVFGTVGASLAGRFGFRVVADSKGIGLYGESGEGTSYAIYELLHRLGCRWYLPSEMGECIPRTPTLTVAEIDVSLAPATQQRRMEGRVSDADFRRRNRLGGVNVSAQHALEGYITKEQREANPEWCLQVDGKPHPRYLRWTRQDVADAIADTIIARLDKSYVSSVSLSPGDYVVPTEDPEERTFDPEPRVWEPAAKQWSVTDRLVLLANRVAERVGEKYPDVLFGLLVYVNYSMPPAKYDVHPNVVPVIAPIDFNRQHPMTWPDHPNDSWLLDMVQGWGEASTRIGYYAYGMNLAELTAPNPFITKWGTNIPIIMKNNFTYWCPETMGGWESMMPGYYLAIRMTFYPEEKPDDILEEMMTRLYGHAAAPMKAYWYHIDRCWIETEEFAGSAFGYLRMFTPERMAIARGHIDDALAACQTIDEFRRVKLIDESLALFEQFMAMREVWAGGSYRDFRTMPDRLDDWRGSLRHLRQAYSKQYSFDSGLALNYVNAYFGKPYEDIARVVRDYQPLSPKPVWEWTYRYDEEQQAEELGWTKPDFDDSAWETTHVVRETWSTIGHHNTMGRMAYRTEARLSALPEGKRAYLWLGSTDGSAKLFVNGRHIPYVVPEKTRHHDAGEVIDAFSGYCQPAQFDITSAIVPGANQITILAERSWLNELGTGGLMGPVLLIREK